MPPRKYRAGKSNNRRKRSKFPGHYPNTPSNFPILEPGPACGVEADGREECCGQSLGMNVIQVRSVMHRTPPEFLAGGGEMGAAIRAFNWAATSLGPPEGWPPTLRTCLRIMLASRQPMWVWWGPELINFYNDAYLPIIGGKHSAAMGPQDRKDWSALQ